MILALNHNFHKLRRWTVLPDCLAFTARVKCGGPNYYCVVVFFVPSSPSLPMHSRRNIIIVVHRIIAIWSAEVRRVTEHEADMSIRPCGEIRAGRKTQSSPLCAAKRCRRPRIIAIYVYICTSPCDRGI